MRRARRLLAVLCVVAFVAAAMLAPVSGGASTGVLVPIDPLFGLVVLPVPPVDDTTPAYSFVPTGPAPSRAPPVIA